MKASNSGMLTDDPAVERLVALGQRKGHLTFDDLRTALPIDSMSGAAIAAAISRVEAAGILIEVEEELLEPVHGRSEQEPSRPPPRRPRNGPGAGRPVKFRVPVQRTGSGDAGVAAAPVARTVVTTSVAVVTILALLVLALMAI